MVKITIKPIPVKKRFDGIGKIIVEEQRKEAKAVKREYQRSTKTWSRQPEFEIDEKDKNIYVETTNPIFGYVDKGTKPHIIKPKRPGYPLRFNSKGFKPKTVPGRLDARAGRPAQPPQVKAMHVKHPGNKPRGITKIVQQRSIERFRKNVEKRLKREYGTT